MRGAKLWLLPILAGVYFAAGHFGLSLAVVHPSVTAVWAPTGIALAAFLIWGAGVWPGIFLGALLVNLATSGSVATSLGIATGNTLEGLVGAYLVNRFARGRDAFERPGDVFRFAGLAGLLSTMVSATFGVTSLSLGGSAPWSTYGAIWFTWWVGDAVGAVAVAPLLVLWSGRRRVRWTRARILEASLLLAALVVTGGLAFGGWLWEHQPVQFICVPALVWIAFRLGPRETATALLLLSGIALYGTVGGSGPFAGAPSQFSLLTLQAFIGTVAVTALTLAAAVTERDTVEASLRKSEELHGAIAALTADFAAVTRVDGGPMVLESVTDGFTLVTGYTPAELELRGGLAALVHPEDRPSSAKALEEVLAGGQVAGDLRIVAQSGETRWVRYFAGPLAERDGGAGRRILIAAQDVTNWKLAEQELEKRQAMIRVLSTPVLRLRDRLLILPVIGDVDTARARQLTQQLMEGIRSHRAKAVVLDLTGVADVEPAAARLLVGTVEEARLLGAIAILSGVSTGIAHRLESIGIDLTTLRTAGDLQAGLDEAQRLLAPDGERAPTASHGRHGRR